MVTLEKLQRFTVNEANRISMYHRKLMQQIIRMTHLPHEKRWHQAVV